MTGEPTPRFGHAEAPDFAGMNLECLRFWWGRTERALSPPVSLLSWLVRHLAQPTDGSAPGLNRAKLIAGDLAAIEDALALLRSAGPSKGWHVLEGATYPDVVIETPDAVVVIEGKRTETWPTTRTKWLEGRHQMWRHLDAAWEVRGRRAVCGFFIVEGAGNDPAEVPPTWREAAELTLEPRVIASSLPHRGLDERWRLERAFLGVTTWQALCREFDVPFDRLPDTVE